MCSGNWFILLNFNTFISKMKTHMRKARLAAVALTILSFTLSCGSNGVAYESWDERDQDLTVIRQGVPVYGAANIDYRRGGKTILKVELQEPVVVAAAEQPENWGYYQFPGIYSSDDGNLIAATWSMHKDSPSSYGKGGSDFRVSSDNGKTWVSAERAPSRKSGLLLPATGERIGIRTPVAPNVSELQLPQPVATGIKSYDRTFSFYRLAEIPEALQGVYMNRWDENGARTEEHAGLEDPRAVRYSDNDLFPVVWWGDMKLLPDNSVVAGIYPMFYENEAGGVDPSGISFYRSTDNGMNWKIQGKIPYSPDLAADPNGDKRKSFGYTEPAFEILSDGTFLCVMRTTDALGNSPMYFSHSADQGATWSQPRAFTSTGVLPKLLRLDNGVIVLASGRPGVQIRFSHDGRGEEWTEPFEMLPFENEDVVSCGYTQFLATGPDSFLVVYSDFKYRNENNEERKAIKVREIKVIKQ